MHTITVYLAESEKRKRKRSKWAIPILIGLVAAFAFGRPKARIEEPVPIVAPTPADVAPMAEPPVAEVPVVVLHGDRDFVVPMAAARDAAKRTAGELVVIQGGTHSWLLKDPETMPGIMHALMRGRLGTAVLRAKLAHGIDPADATDDEVEAALYEPDALVLELTPRQRVHDTEDLHRPPRYSWTVHPARSKGD